MIVARVGELERFLTNWERLPVCGLTPIMRRGKDVFRQRGWLHKPGEGYVG